MERRVFVEMSEDEFWQAKNELWRMAEQVVYPNGVPEDELARNIRRHDKRISSRVDGFLEMKAPTLRSFLMTS